jgi:beta-galactosidase
MPRNRHLEWKVAYAAGRLEAVGYRGGRRIVSSVETTGTPYEIVVTPYQTTMLADGRDASVINISVVDKQGREVPDADNLVNFLVRGDMRIIGVGNGDPSSHEPDKCVDGHWQRHLFNGKCQVIVQTGSKPDRVYFEARSEGLQTGSTDIYTVRAGGQVEVVNSGRDSLGKSDSVDKMLGADISFLPELEAKGIHFSDKGIQKDALQILKDHGFNYIRLRIFNEPARDSGYSPGKGFCDLTHTMQMARRIKAAGMKFLLDFHYSDTWADPGKQYKPEAWKGKGFPDLVQAVYKFTAHVMDSLRLQGTLPDMVQVGNEINHGMIWPEGSISHPDSLAALVYAGIRGVKAVDPACPIMLHLALGGQNDECHFFLDNMLKRGVPFDVIGLSYYPKWHGTLADLTYNVNDLAGSYKKDIIIVEYTQLKREVNEIAFSIPDGRGKGTCIWEPLNTWERMFDEQGRSNEYLQIYDEVSKRFLKTK